MVHDVIANHHYNSATVIDMSQVQWNTLPPVPQPNKPVMTGLLATIAFMRVAKAAMSSLLMPSSLLLLSSPLRDPLSEDEVD